MNNRKPLKCTYPNCFECPYPDCEYDRLELEDFTESNNRDYELYEWETGKKYHKGTDLEYSRNRQVAYKRRNRKYVNRYEYNQKYYKENKEKIKEKQEENYDAEKNATRCRKYREEHKEAIRKYEREYYERNKEKKKQQAKERYYRNKAIKERNRVYEVKV